MKRLISCFVLIYINLWFIDDNVAFVEYYIKMFTMIVLRIKKNETNKKIAHETILMSSFVIIQIAS